ncbi:MAG: peptidylprolyl isomerase [Sphingomonas sp. 28-66-16]|nr:MAG: peptidylprolyl isomerase [Sphingomonas sp. 28-66-16]
MKSFEKARPIGVSVAVAAGIGMALAGALAGGLSAAAIAQTVPDDGLPQTNLNIPANLQLFGKRDPNVRKPTAIVNDSVITGTDVDQRLALVAAANNLKLADGDRERLRLQVLSSLIDETLQIQEARANDIKVTSAEIDQSFERVARNFNKSVPEMRVYLRSIGSSERSLRRQIESELAWTRYLRRRIDPFVNIGDQEVKSIIARLDAARGAEEYHVKEIYLAATPDRQQQVFAEAKALMQEIQQGRRSFEEIAMARSDASTRAVGGDLAWVKANQLPDSLAQAATEMKVSQLAGPIEVPGGYSLLYLVDKRQILTADSRDAKLSLRQISVAFPKGTTQAEASNRVSEFANLTKNLRGCGDVAKVAAALGAEVVDNDSIKVRDLPPALQDMMMKMQVGESTPPFGTPEDGVRALVLCGRDEPKSGELPSMEQVRNQMEQRGVNLRADHKLRDLRRDAVVEYR